MTTDRILKIIFGILSVGLLTTLLIKLTNVTGGMILSGIFLGGIMIVGTIITCLILTGILSLFLRQFSFLTIFFFTTSVSFLAFHNHLYSLKLEIIVPIGYKGQINLVLSKVKNNILTVDSNGIGYIDKWTFDNTYSIPTVTQMDGKNLDKNLVGYNPSTFWAKEKSSSSSTQSGSSEQEIESISFEIVPDNKLGQKQYYSTDLTTLADKKLISNTVNE